MLIRNNRKTYTVLLRYYGIRLGDSQHFPGFPHPQSGQRPVSCLTIDAIYNLLPRSDPLEEWCPGRRSAPYY